MSSHLANRVAKCSAEKLALKASIIKGHIDSSKHKAGKEMLAWGKKRHISIVEAMKKSVVVI